MSEMSGISTAASDPARLSPTTSLGAVSLTVSDLARARAFYEGVLGLHADEAPDGALTLFASTGAASLVTLYGDPVAPARDPHAPGLFHLAILFPSRPALAGALVRLARARWPLSGASDHLVSEALYLTDPDGNGIELYRDRPAEQWPRGEAGELRMATLRLDLDDLLGEVDPEADPTPDPPAGTRMGHVHLQVSDIPRAERFYCDLLGFDPTLRAYPGALFTSAGGYHHHVGLNTWNSAGARPPAPGSLGLRHFEVVVADSDELVRVAGRLSDGGVATWPEPDGALGVRDPFGSWLRLRAA